MVEMSPFYEQMLENLQLGALVPREIKELTKHFSICNVIHVFL